MKRRGSINPMSDRRRRTVNARKEAVALAFARDRGCVAQSLVPSVACGGPLDGHEPLTRARGGDPCDVDNVVILCRSHHDWTHANPSESTALGLLRHAWEAS